MQGARTMDEYIRILNDILDELADLRAAIEYDEEFMEGSMNLVVPLEEGVRTLLADIDAGTYEFAVGELEFVERAKNTNELLLPFKTLFLRIDATHRQGLEQ
ncbi:MAG: hypothetical protein ACC707_10285 [Thiohalomonadales bacterium]